VTPEENARLEAIERRLAWLEARAGKAPDAEEPASPRVVPIAPRLGGAGFRPAPAPETTAPPIPSTPVQQPPEPPHGIETTVGLTWLSRIAVLTIVLFLAFFFKYAFQNHWITESARVLLGIACSGVALGFGERFFRRGQPVYAQALTAVGIAFVYLSCWAAFGLYGLISQTIAFTLMVLATLGAGALALRYDSSAVAMLGLAGGFATPLMLGAARAPAFIFGYALVLDLGTAFASRRRDWRWPEPLALAGTVLLYVTQLPVPPNQRHIFMLFIGAWYVLFAASKQQWLVAAAQVLASLAAIEIWERGDPGLLTILLLAAVGLAIGDARRWTVLDGASFAGFWLVYWMWSQSTDGATWWATVTLLTLAFLLFLGWPLWRVIVREQTLGMADLLGVALNAAFYLGAMLMVVHPVSRGAFTVGLALAQLGAAYLLWRRDQRGAVLSIGIAGVLFVLAAPIQFVGYRITISWALEGAAIAWIATRLRERRLELASLVVFALVLWRLLLFDSEIPAPVVIGNARFLTFTMAAASFCAAAWWIRTGSGALAAYLSGLAVMLWGLCLEAADWAARTAPQDVRSVTSMSITVLAAAYAALLVTGGVMRRSAVTRLAGIVLIGLVVAKLYLYDVWLLAQFYRMTAFGILGALLLAVSYVYTKKRA
jgi:uncharacterized membrane protein